MSLRRLQWKSANKGNVTMQIWLGKQYLGQKDKQEISGDAGPPKAIWEFVGNNAKNKSNGSIPLADRKQGKKAEMIKNEIKINS